MAITDDGLVHELFEHHAELFPDRDALVFEEECLSYATLNKRANQLAHELIDLGVGPDTIVGLCVERSPEMVIGLLGILKAGGAYLPLDPSYPAERLSYMISDSAPLVILTQERLCERLPAGTPMIFLETEHAAYSKRPSLNPLGRGQPQNLAYVIYTSGSTGKPKGVTVSHLSLMNLTHGQIQTYKITCDDRVLQLASIGFDMSVEEIYPALCSGATLVLASDRLSASWPEFLSVIQKHDISYLNVATVIWRRLIEWMIETTTCWPQSLRLISVGGESVDMETYRLWKSTGGREIYWANAYGPTELTVNALILEEPPGGLSGDVVPIGRPIRNAKSYILGDQFELVPRGAVGELYIGGLGLARGYLGRPDLTAERFVPDPFGGEGGRLYRTGDLARYRLDGNVEFLGRIDNQVKIRGFRIELGEIEASLSRMEEVLEAIVMAREDAHGEKRLVTYVVGHSGRAVDVEALRGALGRELPDYMVPAAFVVLDALPLNRNGKIDRKALPAPGMEFLRRGVYVAPRTATEETLCGIWSEVLGVDRVGVEDNFFELGGHSLSAVRLLSRLEASLGVSVPITVLFETPTPSNISAFIEISRGLNLGDTGADFEELEI